MVEISEQINHFIRDILILLLKIMFKNVSGIIKILMI